MNQTELSKLKGDYGYVPSSYQYVPMAFELMKCIGQAVVMITYRKEETEPAEGEEKPESHWSTEMSMVRLVSIYDHDPMTMTNMLKYRTSLEDNEGEEVEVRVQPEGYEFVNAEETGMFRRFQPVSLHHKMIEDELFFARLRTLYDSRDTLSFEELKTISDSKDQGQILRYSHNIGAAIELEDGDLIWIRLHTLKLKHRKGNMYGLFFSESGKEWSTIVYSDEKVHTIGDWGKFKIIDLSD